MGDGAVGDDVVVMVREVLQRKLQVRAGDRLNAGVGQGAGDVLPGVVGGNAPGGLERRVREPMKVGRASHVGAGVGGPGVPGFNVVEAVISGGDDPAVLHPDTAVAGILRGVPVRLERRRGCIGLYDVALPVLPLKPPGAVVQANGVGVVVAVQHQADVVLLHEPHDGEAAVAVAHVQESADYRVLAACPHRPRASGLPGVVVHGDDPRPGVRAFLQPVAQPAELTRIFRHVAAARPGAVPVNSFRVRGIALPLETALVLPRLQYDTEVVDQRPLPRGPIHAVRGEKPVIVIGEGVVEGPVELGPVHLPVLVQRRPGAGVVVVGVMVSDDNEYRHVELLGLLVEPHLLVLVLRYVPPCAVGLLHVLLPEVVIAGEDHEVGAQLVYLLDLFVVVSGPVSDARVPGGPARVPFLVVGADVVALRPEDVYVRHLDEVERLAPVVDRVERVGLGIGNVTVAGHVRGDGYIVEMFGQAVRNGDRHQPHPVIRGVWRRRLLQVGPCPAVALGGTQNLQLPRHRVDGVVGCGD